MNIIFTQIRVMDLQVGCIRILDERMSVDKDKEILLNNGCSSVYCGKDIGSYIETLNPGDVVVTNRLANFIKGQGELKLLFKLADLELFFLCLDEPEFSFTDKDSPFYKILETITNCEKTNKVRWAGRPQIKQSKIEWIKNKNIREGTPISKLCRDAGITRRSFYNKCK